MMRPSVAAPTGTLIGLPVASTARPRFRPSEEPIAIVRTTPSPSCCCTSSVSSTSLSLSASYTRGIESRGNSTSMTAPMIWVILPRAMFVTSNDILSVLAVCLGCLDCLDGRRAAHDLGQFLGDRGLAGLVVDELQLVDELAGVVGGGLHRHHRR